jgi:hypothetical protein
MPYGYFQLVRIISLTGFLILAYMANKSNFKITAIFYIGLIILFQPFFKIYLGRQIWNIVDVIVAFCLITSMFISLEKKKTL